MEKKLVRNVRPDIFAMIKDKCLHYNVGVGCINKIEFICPRCGAIITQSVNNVIRSGLSCKKCGDGISFGEKFIFNILEQLNLNFDTHIMFPWSDHRIYDIVLYQNNQPYVIVEVHGKQHYKGGFETYGGRDYSQELENDNYKMNLAFSNGFNRSTYVAVDCRESSFEYIKRSIQENVFFKQYDVSGVDWNKCMENALSSYAIKAQALWNEGYKIADISSILKISRTTIRKYLKQGAEIGVCTYSVSNSYHRRRVGTFIPTPTKMVFSPELQQIFYSLSDAHRYTNISLSSICNCLKGTYKYAGKLSDGTHITWFETSFENALLLEKDGYYQIIGDKPTYVSI